MYETLKQFKKKTVTDELCPLFMGILLYAVYLITTEKRGERERERGKEREGEREGESEKEMTASSDHTQILTLRISWPLFCLLK